MLLSRRLLSRTTPANPFTGTRCCIRFFYCVCVCVCVFVEGRGGGGGLDGACLRVGGCRREEGIE